MSLASRSALVLSLLFGLVFAIGAAVLWTTGAPVWIALVFALAITGLQYAIGPLIIQWIFRIEWCAPEAVAPGFAAWLTETCAARGIPVPRVGVIPDGRPNAFTFGHTPGNARLVVTRGLVDVLSEEELHAVAAHELGHIRNWDFVVMTVASAVPLMLYMLYTFTRKRDSRDSGYVWIVGIAAYVAYIASQYIVLILSRVREYFADDFSAQTTRDPNALASALVTIAYGLARTPITTPEPDAETGKRKGKGKRAAKPMDWAGAAAPLGVSNSRMAMPFAAATCDAEGNFSLENMQRAMRWELVNPWARLYEIGSTHPLAARRISALERCCTRLGQPCRYPVTSAGGAPYTGSFPRELLMTALPYLGIAAGVAAAASSVMQGALQSLGWIAILGGAGWLARLAFEYPSGARQASIVSLLGEVDVSHIRSIPVEVRGRIVGRGVPGLFFSEDLVLQDDEGFVTIDYRQPFGLWEFLFAAFRADRFIGKSATVRGWYRRSPMPFVEVREIEVEGERTVRCYHYPAKYAGALLVIAAGLLVTFALPL